MDITKFNLALLAKWKWNLFYHNGELWARILDSKYGGWRGLDAATIDNNASLWWADLKLALHNPQHEMVLKGGLTWKVGNGTKIKFWEDHWGFGDTSLLAKYPSLYLISDQQHNYIQEMGQQTDKGWEWKFKWRRHLFDRELEMADCFLSEVAGSSIQIHKKDEWIWKAEPTGQYSVRSAYNMLKGVDAEEDNVWAVSYKHLTLPTNREV